MKGERWRFPCSPSKRAALQTKRPSDLSPEEARLSLGHLLWAPGTPAASKVHPDLHSRLFILRWPGVSWGYLTPVLWVKNFFLSKFLLKWGLENELLEAVLGKHDMSCIEKKTNVQNVNNSHFAWQWCNDHFKKAVGNIKWMTNIFAAVQKHCCGVKTSDQRSTATEQAISCDHIFIQILQNLVWWPTCVTSPRPPTLGK